MKYRESGMPEQAYWETLFDIEGILDSFAIGPKTGAVAELGCGYGTFTLPVARRTAAPVHTYDIDSQMVQTTWRRASEHGLANVHASVRDVFANGFGLPSDSCGAALLFNILHGEHPIAMLREAARVVANDGAVAVIHWRSDITTPRGPSMDIRPTPEQIIAWAREVPELRAEALPILLPPWHFGIRFAKRSVATSESK
ncbi:class I SAM-dependent methyltransferase [Nibricoccus sp. IMCC34717]|uniref:class I SAM-dependent methyltransferase n=1 Tax=Nibricoccus sp. IMCC34717 TaxID=3034021 RepID=UPI00384BFFCA